MNGEIRAFDVCDYEWRRCINSSMVDKCINTENVEQENKRPFPFECKTLSVMIDLMGASFKGVVLIILAGSSAILERNGVISQPICPNGGPNCQISTGALFDRAVKLSHYIHSLSSDMFNEFDERFTPGRRFLAKSRMSCHTSSLNTPEDKEQAQQIQHEDLLNLVLKVLRSWNDPLLHMVSEVQDIREAPDTILWKAVEVEEQTKRLLEGMERIVGRVNLIDYDHKNDSSIKLKYKTQIHPGDLENEVYSPWPGPPASLPGDENSRLFAFYNLLHCLRRDSHKIDNYLKLLKCRLIHEGNC
ncbi:unnamed protein product [Ranitomeya imitator]|uniref:Prolactin n=1 Tax=Ranitomeya imitator TaxID=111125 RepID=A0ABN9MH89_9NEOB|nr:unnamed protein product [Ranitomeya imitator]